MSSAIPDGWKAYDLGDLAKKIEGGGTPSRDISEYWNGGIPWATVKDLKNVELTSTQEFISKEGLNNSSSKLIPAHTLILACRMAIGKAVYFDKDVAINQDLKAFHTGKSINWKFLLHWYLSKSDVIESMGTGSTVKGIRLDDLKTMPVSLPPLPEQQKIATILSSVDDVIEKTQAQIDKLKDLKTGMMQELLTKGIGHTEFKDSPVGRIPVGWDVFLLGDIAEYVNGNSFKAADWTDTGYPIIRIQNLNGDGNFNYYNKEVNPKWFVETGSLLFAWSGQRGKSFGARIWNGKNGVLNQHIFKVNVNEEHVTKEYLHLLMQLVQVDIERHAHGFKDSFMHVKKSDLVGHDVALPSLEEQSRITEVVSSIDRKLELTKVKLGSSIKTKKALMQDLLTGKVRVSVN